ncbi:MAG: hypothetical protein ACJAVI_004179 [Candidatus Azotimanducaceae bacterium]|jgi:hypothetical protein
MKVTIIPVGQKALMVPSIPQNHINITRLLTISPIAPPNMRSATTAIFETQFRIVDTSNFTKNTWIMRKHPAMHALILTEKVRIRARQSITVN